jgi:hypothetical protein
MGRPSKSSRIEGESLVERNKRLTRERVARRKNEESLARINERPPVIEGESMVERNKRLDIERVARKRIKESLGRINERPPVIEGE